MIKEYIREYPLLSGIIIATLLVAAYFFDEIRWKLKSDEKIIKMTKSTDPKRIMIGIKHLNKRKKDISEYINAVLPFLIANSAIDRVTAKIILQKYYSEDYSLIKDYNGTDNLNKCREKADNLLKKYKINS